MTATKRWTQLLDSIKAETPFKSALVTGVEHGKIQSALDYNKTIVETELTVEKLLADSLDQSVDLIFADAQAIVDNSTQFNDPKSGLVDKRSRLCQITALDLESYRSFMLVGDGFGIERPTLPEKLATANYLIKLGLAIGLERPKVAVLAAVEVVYPQMSVTCDGAVLAKMSDRGQIKNGLVDGPLSFDVAIDPEVAKGKGVTSSTVAGQAQALLAPDPQTARGIHQALVKFAKAGHGTVIVGGKTPIIPVGPLDTPSSVLNSIALARLLG